MRAVISTVYQQAAPSCSASFHTLLCFALCNFFTTPSPQGTKVNSRGVEVPQHVRLYSIASSRYGDSGDGQTCTLCVVRVIYPGEV